MANWFRRPTPEFIKISGPSPTSELNDRIPKDLWHKCRKCAHDMLRKEFLANLSVCEKCGRHERVSAKERIRQLVDPGSFVETHGNLAAADPLNFEDKRKYSENIEANRRKTGLNDSLVSGHATIGEVPVSLAVMDFGFMGGSMGSVLGEKVTRAMELSIERRIPCISITATGGARMQEGILSLMQMAKTSILCAQMEELGIPFVSILTDPSTAGVMASFASLGDIIIAEPGAYVGFAGRRVIENTIKQPLPPGFQTSEFQRDHGFVDIVVERRKLRGVLITTLRQFTGRPPYREVATPPEATPVPAGKAEPTPAAPAAPKATGSRKK